MNKLAATTAMVGWVAFVWLMGIGTPACPPPGPPAPVPPDADAAPAPLPPVTDAAPAPAPDSSRSCLDACAQLTTLCGPQPGDCAAVLQLVNDHSTIRMPCGQTLCPTLTCAAISAATTVAAVKALGLQCP